MRSPTAPAQDVMDVWSRSESKYRIRAIALLVLNILLFAGVSSFAYWLRSGEVFAPAMESYTDQLFRTLDFTSESADSLGSLLLEAINVQDVPMQIPVLGLLMAALVSIPILISILYRFWACLPFLAVVGLLAVMPWLAITLCFSCVIASVEPFRTRYRFVSALLGLLPVVLYLVLASSGTEELIAGRVEPIDQIQFVAPWVLAVVAAAAVFAIVLTLAEVVNYRPGAVAPLLAVMFVLPVILFEFHVGRDELYYRRLQAHAAAWFADTDASIPLNVAVGRAWERHPLPRPKWDKLYAEEQHKWTSALSGDTRSTEAQLVRHQIELAEMCDWFRKYFPDSRYTLNVLYLKAHALDLRVDVVTLGLAPWIRYCDEFPSPASRKTWRLLAANGEATGTGAVAQLRLAQLESREPHTIDQAIDRLKRLINRLEASQYGRGFFLADGYDDPGTLDRSPPESGLGIHLDQVYLRARQLHDLLSRNDDPLYGYRPITGPSGHETVWFGLQDLVPFDDHYADNLTALQQAYPHCQIADNIDLEIAKATPKLDARIRLLERCREAHHMRDAAAEILFRLAVDYKADGQSDKSRLYIAELYEKHPDTVWSRQAALLSTAPSSMKDQLP